MTWFRQAAEPGRATVALLVADLDHNALVEEVGRFAGAQLVYANLDDTNYTTLGGYVFGQLGRLPRPGDRVTAGPFTFEVAEMEGRRVKSVKLVAPSPTASTVSQRDSTQPAGKSDSPPG